MIINIVIHTYRYSLNYTTCHIINGPQLIYTPSNKKLHNPEFRRKVSPSVDDTVGG